MAKKTIFDEEVIEQIRNSEEVAEIYNAFGESFKLLVIHINNGYWLSIRGGQTGKCSIAGYKHTLEGVDNISFPDTNNNDFEKISDAIYKIAYIERPCKYMQKVLFG